LVDKLLSNAMPPFLTILPGRFVQKRASGSFGLGLADYPQEYVDTLFLGAAVHATHNHGSHEVVKQFIAGLDQLKVSQVALYPPVRPGHSILLLAYSRYCIYKPSTMNANHLRKTSHHLVRWAILAVVLLYVSWEFYAHSAVDKVHPSVHALCPLGGLESLLQWITADGMTLGKIFSGTMGLFFVSVGTTLLFKRSFCGNVCPLGTLQDLTGTLGKKVLGRRFVVPPKLDAILRWAKYGVLVLTVIMAWITGTLWIQTFDPWPAYSHLFAPEELFPGYAIGLVILVLSLVASFFFERAFCKYLCPMGAMTAIIGLVSPYRVHRNTETCIDCGLCDKACPVNIVVSKANTVRSAECISCADCAAVCPVPKTLDIGIGTKTRINPAAAVALGAGAFFLGLFILQLAGFDRYSGRQEPTLRELARNAGVTTTEFKATYDLPASLFDGTRSSVIEKAIPLARMAEMNGVDTAAMKAQLGLDPALPDDTPWGIAWGKVTVAKIAELNGMSLEVFKKTFLLKNSVAADTPWKDVEKAVLRAAARLGRQGGEEMGHEE